MSYGKAAPTIDVFFFLYLQVVNAACRFEESCCCAEKVKGGALYNRIKMSANYIIINIDLVLPFLLVCS